MSAIEHSLDWRGNPYALPLVHPRWLNRGLRSAYLLRPGLWNINLVTRGVGGVVSGSGFVFEKDGRLRTAYAASSGVLLNHRLATNIALPVSFAVGWERAVVSSTVAWSLLRNDSTQWTGWYGEATGDIRSTNANSFDGLLSFGSDVTSLAFAHAAAGDLRGYGRGTAKVSDASANAPASISQTQAVIGFVRRTTDGNHSYSLFTHWYAFQASLTDDELAELADDHMRLFEDRQIIVPVASAPAIPSLTLSSGHLTHSPSPAPSDQRLWLSPTGALVAAASQPSGHRPVSLSAGAWTAGSA